MALDPILLEVLACPEDKGPLYYLADEDALYNPRLKRRYACATASRSCSSTRPSTVDDGEHDRIMAKVEADGLKPTFTASTA